MINNVLINHVDFVENITHKNLLIIMNNNAIKKVLKDKIVTQKIILNLKAQIKIIITTTLLMKIMLY